MKIKSLFVLILFILIEFPICGFDKSKVVHSNKKKTEISGDFILRSWNVEIKTTSGVTKNNYSWQLGGRLKTTYLFNPELSITARANIGSPERPYCRYIRLNGSFEWYLDQFYVKLIYNPSVFLLGRHPTPYLKLRSNLVMSKNISLDGVSYLHMFKGSQIHMGYARLTEGTEKLTSGDFTDNDNKLLYAGIQFGTQKNIKGRVTIINYKLQNLNPFGSGHAAEGKYYAYNDKYLLVNTALSATYNFSGYPCNFMLEYNINLDAEKGVNINSSDKSAYFAGFKIGKFKKSGDLEAEMGYYNVGQKSTIGYYTSCGNRVNSKGIRFNLSLKISSLSSIKLIYMNASRKNKLLTGPFENDKRNSVMFVTKF